jgi:hypothetical protein
MKTAKIKTGRVIANKIEMISLYFMVVLLTLFVDGALLATIKPKSFYYLLFVAAMAFFSAVFIHVSWRILRAVNGRYVSR